MSVISVATASSSSPQSSASGAGEPPQQLQQPPPHQRHHRHQNAHRRPLSPARLHDLSYMTMDFQSAMETFAEAWVAANAKTAHHLAAPDLANIQSQAMALTRPQCRTPPAAHSNHPPTSATIAHVTSSNAPSTTPTSAQLQGATSLSITSSTTTVGAMNTSSGDSSEVAPLPRPPIAHGSPTPARGDLSGCSPMLSIKEEPGLDSMKQNGKSLPIHCIVESVCTLDDGRLAQGISSTASTPQTPSGAHQQPGVPTPIHVNMGGSAPWRRRSIVEVDSFVIIPAATSFHDLVQVALLRLGYGPESAAAAKATVVIKNWKPLNFEQISEDPLACVGDILGDLTSVVTLRMQVFRGRPGALADIKDKLLRFLLVQSHGLLVSAGCPLDELILSQICRLPAVGGGSLTDISDDCRRKFDHWWHSQVNPQSPSSNSRTPAPVTPQLSAPSTPIKDHHHEPVRSHLPTEPIRPPANSTPVSHLHPPAIAHQSLVHGNHPFPAVAAVSQQKTRMRTSFDPELELPKLQRWFADNQHPSRQQIQQYVKELNGLESRRGRKPLDVNNVVYWFKNARAAQKRAEIRGVSGVLGPHLSVNGYNGHSPTNGSGYLVSDGYLSSERMMLDHRLKSGYSRSGGSGSSGPRMNLSHAMDDYSNAGSDLDEEDMTEGNATPSPVAPLSLTTGRKDDSRETSPRPRTPTAQSFPKVEPINYHSPDHSNNNKTPTSDGDDADDMEVVDDSTDTKNFAGAPMFRSNSVSSYTRSISPNDFLRQTAVAAAVAAAANNESECIERLAAAFPIGSNSMFGHSIMYMSQYIPSLNQHNHHHQHQHHHQPVSATSPPHGPHGPHSASLALSALSADERRKRNRTFIDPVTEVPRLEQWFSLNTHPSHNLILKYTEELNCMAYRQKFPRLEPKNVQFWFKNRRAKCKRLKMSLFEGPSAPQYHHAEDKE